MNKLSKWYDEYKVYNLKLTIEGIVETGEEYINGVMLFNVFYDGYGDRVFQFDDGLLLTEEQIDTMEEDTYGEAVSEKNIIGMRHWDYCDTFKTKNKRMHG